MLLFYGHPFSSYTWKALIALYEKDIAFDYRIVEPDRPQHMEELRAYWPIGQFPLIVDEGVPWFEATIIIDYNDPKAPDPGLIPSDPAPALNVRRFARLFALHVIAPMPAVVGDRLPGP